jgi:acyl-CoA reductase-like NAD-dependent aldehyde dehydrogenase
MVLATLQPKQAATLPLELIVAVKKTTPLCHSACNNIAGRMTDIPFGGAKQSGIGEELGREGLEAYTQAKIINMAK